MAWIDRFKAVLFDMDGLMIDSERMAIDAWKRAGREFGFAIGDDVCLRMVGRNDADSEQILASSFAEDFPLRAIAERYGCWLQELVARGEVALKPGLMELLAALGATPLRLAVATSTERGMAVRKLAIHDLLPYFTVVTTGDEVRRGKPAPDIYLLTAERLGVSPCDCLVLEDSNAGVEAAFEAGATPIMVPDILEPTLESRKRAERIVPSLFDVAELVKDGGDARSEA